MVPLQVGTEQVGELRRAGHWVAVEPWSSALASGLLSEERLEVMSFEDAQRTVADYM